MMLAVPFTDSAPSEVLDPEFVCELRAASAHYIDNQKNADDDKWAIASKANEMWGEHKSLFDTKLDYLAECSRVMNYGRKRKWFSDSGETLRRWCETHATYAVFVDKVQDADKFLDLLSFDHLARAKSLYLKGKVKSPFLALAAAVEQNFTADEMQTHFDPPTKPDEWDVMRDRVEAMADRNFWKLKSVENIKKVLFHVGEIRKIVEGDK